MRSLIGLAVGIVTAYLFGAFVTLEPDFRLWSMDARFNTSILAMIHGWFGALAGALRR